LKHIGVLQHVQQHQVLALQAMLHTLFAVRAARCISYFAA
jgi:hypothetical protein